MKVRCIYNDFSEISDKIKKKYPHCLSCSNLTQGKEYLVYAITEFYGYTWFCICEDSFIYFPRYLPFPLFEISDQRLSRYWVFGLQENGFKEIVPCIAYPEWVNEKYYYYDLVEGEKREKSKFSKYKELMDLEFPDESITRSVQIGDDVWLICPDCLDAWESPSAIDALVICPFCQKKFNNPRYQNR